MVDPFHGSRGRAVAYHHPPHLGGVRAATAPIAKDHANGLDEISRQPRTKLLERLRIDVHLLATPRKPAANAGSPVHLMRFLSV